jgi:hypothetical protein
VALVAMFATAASCSGSPINPTPPPPTHEPPAPGASLIGVWEVQYRVTTCQGYRGCGPSMGQIRRGSLRLAAAGSTFQGVFTIGVRDAIDIAGPMIEDGDAVLKGFRPAALPTDDEVEITRLRVQKSGTGLSGDLDYTVRGPANAAFWGLARITAEIVSAERTRKSSELDANFTGTWEGYFVVRDCAFVGWDWCYPHNPEQVHWFTLKLTQTGSHVAGTMVAPLDIPVTGIVSAGVLELRGSETDSDRSVRITSWSTRRDPFGRMSGTFGFMYEWPGVGDGTRLYSTTYRVVELRTTLLTD